MPSGFTPSCQIFHHLQLDIFLKLVRHPSQAMYIVDPVRRRGQYPFTPAHNSAGSHPYAFVHNAFAHNASGSWNVNIGKCIPSQASIYINNVGQTKRDLHIIHLHAVQPPVGTPTLASITLP